ncbi:MAG: hypothetical protein ABFD69_04085 [Candidatus Sumerlaeia bacterium]
MKKLNVAIKKRDISQLDFSIEKCRGRLVGKKPNIDRIIGYIFGFEEMWSPGHPSAGGPDRSRGDIAEMVILAARMEKPLAETRG